MTTNWPEERSHINGVFFIRKCMAILHVGQKESGGDILNVALGGKVGFCCNNICKRTSMGYYRDFSEEE